MFAFFFRRTRWMIVGWAARAGVKALGRKRVDDAADDLRQRLPDKAVKVADALPGDLLRAGGSAVVAGQTARRSAQAGKQLATAKERAREKLRVARSELGDSVEEEERSFRSDLLRYTRGETAATDALLDVRGVLDHEAPGSAIPKVGPPVSGKRWRRAIPTVPLVERAQRRYSQPRKAWD